MVFKGIHKIMGVQVGTVGELGSFANMEGPDQTIVADRIAVSIGQLCHSVLADAGQAAVDVVHDNGGLCIDAGDWIHSLGSGSVGVVDDFFCGRVCG